MTDLVLKFLHDLEGQEFLPLDPPEYVFNLGISVTGQPVR